MHQAKNASNLNTSAEKTSSPLAKAGFITTGNSNEFIMQEKDIIVGEDVRDTGEKVMEATML